MAKRLRRLIIAIFIVGVFSKISVGYTDSQPTPASPILPGYE